MASQPQPQWVVPNTGIPRTFGVLNIIFGVVLLLVGLGYAAWAVMAPTFIKQIQVQTQEALAKAKAEREAQVAELKKKEAAAKTAEEKEQLKTERAAIEVVVEPPDMADLTNWDMYADPRYQAYFWGDVSTGILLNLAMIVAGAGLLATAEWGRRLAIGVAWGKILRLLAMAVITLTVVLPMTTERTQRAFEKMEAQMKARPGGAAPQAFSKEVARMSAVFGAVASVGFTVVGAIYPALAIWFLTRPRARAACAGRLAGKPDGKPSGAWPGDEAGPWAADEPGGR
jgi:hypothetical protein